MTFDFWKGKKIFLTGHTGFKGSWLSLWLQQLGAEVIGYSLQPPTSPNLFEAANVSNKMESIIADIRDLTSLKKAISSVKPEIVIHMAAQPLVRLSYDEPVQTFETNVMGTVNLLESVRHTPSVKSVLIVTTDKCYENKEWSWGYRENEPMGGHDPYSSSKGCAELVTAAFRSSFFNLQKDDKQLPAIATVRAGNVIGGGDWASDRLIPDILHAFEQTKTVKIRNPDSVRPWQHVLEPLYGYLTLAEKLFNNGHKYAEAWNFGPKGDDAKSVKWIVEHLVNAWGKGASWKLDSHEHVHEANYLKLDISKAKNLLEWQPLWSLDHALQKIVEWHKSWIAKENINELCNSQIIEYTKLINSKTK